MRLVIVIVCSASLAACKSSSSSDNATSASAGSGGAPAASGDPVRAEQAKAFRSGWAAAPATPGAVFGALAVGGPARGVVEHYTKLRGSFSTEYVTPEGDDPRLLAMFSASRVVISAKTEGENIIALGLWTNDERDVGCPPDLAPSLREAWKAAPHAAYEDLDVWLDPARRMRAILNTGVQCRLEYERYEPAETWLDNVAHVELVGKPAAALAPLGIPEARWKAGTGTIDWSDVGCGLGGGIANISAVLENGTIVAMRASTFGGPKATFEAVLAAAVARHGQPREVTGLSVRRFEWSGTMPLRLDEDNGHLDVEAGRLGP